jgi:hypothetical protein
MRRAARIDANQAEIVQTLRDEGCSVWIIGLPLDLLVGVNLRTALVECKDGSKRPSKRRHTELQREFIATWRGGTVATIYDAEGARTLARTMKA